jgi:nicotinamidase-related amidase
MIAPTLSLPIRWYQIGKQYGPGMPQEIDEGEKNAILQKPVNQVGIVSVHCWNLGESSGPYPIEQGIVPTGKVEDWVPAAQEIIKFKIQPVFTAAREAGVTIFHLGVGTYAQKYPANQEIISDPEMISPTNSNPLLKGCVNPRNKVERLQDLFGDNWPGAVWNTHSDIFDIAMDVKPLPHEPVITDGWQLNNLCRKLGIDTLLYVGFMADICIQRIPGAMREMAEKYKYKTIILRDCTVAYEYPETYKDRWMTFAAIRNIETDIGFSALSEGFINGVKS